MPTRVADLNRPWRPTLPGRPSYQSGEISESALPANVSAGYGIAVGPDGDVWFTEPGNNKIGRLSASGTFVRYDIPTARSFPYGIAVAADGSVWFTERNAGKIGRIAP